MKYKLVFTFHPEAKERGLRVETDSINRKIEIQGINVPDVPRAVLYKVIDTEHFLEQALGVRVHLDEVHDEPTGTAS